MDAVKFTLSGRTAFFKKPDVNSYYYFSYNMIHRVALLGMLGAILGYGGYNQQSGYSKQKSAETNSGDSMTYPAFYEKLQQLKIAIVPHYHSIPKKMQSFNNSVGYASKELGGNLIAKEQWLENPQWDIYVALCNDEAEKLKNSLKERRFVYLPYLGKNDHPADISDVEICVNLDEVGDPERIDSLFLKSDFEIKLIEDISLEDNDGDDVPAFKYEEKLPFGLEAETNRYLHEHFLLTNQPVRKKGMIDVYGHCGKNIVFI